MTLTTSGLSLRTLRPRRLAAWAGATLLLVGSAGAATGPVAMPASPFGELAAGLDVTAIRETVRHHVGASVTRPGALEVRGVDYRSVFDGSGFELIARAPVQPGGTPGFERAPALRLGLAAVELGSRRVDVQLRPWCAELNRAERRVAPWLVERVTSLREGLKWDYVVDRHPGGGELSVRAALDVGSHPEVVSEDGESALRWSLPDGRWLRMGELLVHDATGRELHRALPLADRDSVTLQVPASALDSAAYPVTLDPLVSIEYPVGDPRYGPEEWETARPDVASDGEIFLVVWHDFRWGSHDIFGARVDSDGTLLDPAGFAILRTSLNSPGIRPLQPSVAHGETDFLVTWGGLPVIGANGIQGTRVSTDGEVLDDPPLDISLTEDPDSSSGILPARDPDVSWDGSDFVVVFQGSTSDGDAILANQVSVEGAVLHSESVVVADDGDALRSHLSHPRTAGLANGDHLVVWADQRDVNLHARRYDADLAPLDADSTPLGLTDFIADAPAIASNGDEYLVVFGRGGNLKGLRVAADGSLPGGSAFPVSNGAWTARRPALAWDGEHYLAVWHDRRTEPGDIFGTRIEADGDLLDGPSETGGFPIGDAGDEQDWPSVASNGERFLATWEDRRSARVADIYGARVEPDASVADPDGLPICTDVLEPGDDGGRNSQQDPAVAWNGTHYLVVWQDDAFWRGTSEGDIYGARLTPEGALLDGAGIAISTAAGLQSRPEVAWDGTNFVVAWLDERSGGNRPEAHAARVSSAGLLLDGPPDTGGLFLADEVNFALDIASNGSGTLIAYLKRTFGTARDLHAVRLAPDGTVLDPGGFPVSELSGRETAPEVASNGTDYVVVYQDNLNSSSPKLRATRVSAGGEVLDEEGVLLCIYGGLTDPAVAWGDSSYLVTWSVPSSSGNVLGARLTADGVLLDDDGSSPGPSCGFAIAAGSGTERYSRVAWNGVHHLVAWQSNFDYHGARVTPDAEVLDPTGFPIDTSGMTKRGLELAAGPGEQVAATYEVPEPGASHSESYLRFIEPCEAEISCPADVTVECGDDSSPAATGEPEASGCSQLNVFHSDEREPACGSSGTIRRRWVATDNVSSAECEQLIHVVDATPPTATAGTIEACYPTAAEAEEAALAATSGSDACSDVTMTASATGGCDATVTVIVTDACGNDAEPVLYATSIDTGPPTILGVPADATVACDEVPEPATPTATDDCAGDVALVFEETTTPGECPQSSTITRSWRATDLCGNVSVETQVLTVVDEEPPTLVGVPDDATVECHVPPPPATPTAFDDCDPDVSVSFREESEGSPCEGDATLTRIWEAVDACGNSTVATQVLTLRDTTPPVISGVPADATVECDAIPAPATPTATDSCDDAPSLVLTEEVDAGPCEGSFTLTRTWRATDACGNVATETQVLTVVDTTPPQLSGVPADTTVDCGSVPPPAAPTASDACDEAPVVDFTESTEPGPCPQSYTLTRTWTATDSCGNASTESQVLTVVDTTAPVLAGVPADTIVECDAVPAPARPTATDDCDPNVEVVLTETTTPGACPQSYTITRSWRATDACGNASTESQVLTVIDTVAPVLTGIPADATVSCASVPAPVSPTATDACDPDVTVAFTERVEAGPCPQSYTLHRTWEATDACGNRSERTRTLTVVDSTAPVIAGVPADATVECDAVPPPASVTVTDDCDPAPTIAFQEVRIDGDCPGNYTLRRRWTATDACGNSSTRTRILTVRDTTPPVIVASEAELACLWPPNHAMVSFEQADFAPAIVDNCSEPVTWEFVGCASDQPVNSTGDGDTDVDCIVASDGTRFGVRAERSGGLSDGRRYSVAIVATDACGNRSAPVEIGRVLVPHDRSDATGPCRSAPGGPGHPR